MSHLGHRSQAAEHAGLALAAAQTRESGLRYHRELGLVGAKHADVVQQLRELADTRGESD